MFLVGYRARIRNLAKLRERMNRTASIDLYQDSDFDVSILDDLMNVEGLSALAEGLQETAGGTANLRDLLFRERYITLLYSFCKNV